jgi:hypothetical protein
MMVNGDYRGSNYTMSSDDEVFNVSCLFSLNSFLVPSNKKVDSAWVARTAAPQWQQQWAQGI